MRPYSYLLGGVEMLLPYPACEIQISLPLNQLSYINVTYGIDTFEYFSVHSKNLPCHFAPNALYNHAVVLDVTFWNILKCCPIKPALLIIITMLLYHNYTLINWPGII